MTPERANDPALPRPPYHLTAVAMRAESGCSRCERQILLLEKAFLDESYAAVCVHCVADAYNLISIVRPLGSEGFYE